MAVLALAPVLVLPSLAPVLAAAWAAELVAALAPVWVAALEAALALVRTRCLPKTHKFVLSHPVAGYKLHATCMLYNWIHPSSCMDEVLAWVPVLVLPSLAPVLEAAWVAELVAASVPVLVAALVPASAPAFCTLQYDGLLLLLPSILLLCCRSCPYRSCRSILGLE